MKVIIALNKEEVVEFQKYWGLKDLGNVISQDDHSTTVSDLSPSWIKSLNKDRVDFYSEEK